MRKILVFGLLFGTIGAWNAGCTGDDDDDGHEAPVSIALTPSNPTLVVGSSLQLTATGTFADNSTEDLTAESTWSTNSASVATVNAMTGLVTAQAAGSATISADHDGVIGTTTVTVTTGAAVTFDLTFAGTGFGAHNGQTVLVRVLDGATQVHCEVLPAVTGGAWSTNVTALLEQGKTYSLEAIANLDGNSVYNSGTDHTYSRSVPAVSGDVSITIDHSGGQSAVTWGNGNGC